MVPSVGTAVAKDLVKSVLGLVGKRIRPHKPDRDRQVIESPGVRVLLQREPGATIVYDVRCSEAVPDLVSRAGGEPLMWRPGHVYIKPRTPRLNGKVCEDLDVMLCRLGLTPAKV